MDILSTKLYIPPPRDNAVFRPQLIEQLEKGLGRKLILVSAPAGFGKTTLVSEWITGCQQPVAWLSLDDGDNDPARFWSHLIVALQMIVENVGAAVLGMIQSPQPPSIEAILTSLINEITLIPDDFILVMDDYQLLDSKQNDDGLTFFIERLPPQMHLVIVTREDPDLPLARLRARDELIELRVKDLRFKESETAEFLNQTMGLRLSAEDIAALEVRTEGWIAGLQLAALSMQGLEDTAGFIHSFTGSHHFVLDYLIEEVLHKQPESIQTFLLQTSILERMGGQLCDAVLLDPSITGQETLEYLEHANLFIIPQDNERHWYRYHHLFAELLRTRLARAYPDKIADLHRRASDWYIRNDLPNEAVTHALAIQDWTRAAEIIERFYNELVTRGAVSALLGWLESFPGQILLDRRKLGLVYARALNLTNQLDRAEKHLDQLTSLIQTSRPLLGEALAIRVMIAAYRSDLSSVIELSQQALLLLPPEAVSPRSSVLLSLGVAYDEMGDDITAAKRAFREAFELGKSVTSGNKGGGVPATLTAFAHLPDIEWRLGNLHEASRVYEQALELAKQWNGESSIAACRVQWGRAILLYEWNDLNGAAHASQEAIRIGELWGNPRLLVHSYGLSSMVMQARGQTDEARAMIRRAEQITRDSYSPPPTLGSLAFYQIGLWVVQNDFQAITKWEQDHDAEWQSQVGRVRDVLAIVLARAYIARYYQRHDDSALSQARALIQPALEHAQTSGLMLNVTRLLIFNALVLYAQRETAPAIETLKRALALAEPENYIRSFLDLGKPMEEFLLWSLDSQSLTEPRLRVYVSKLLSHFGADISVKSSHPTSGALIEPLSQRELDVLRLIAKGLSNREISERLFLALSTVKGHTRIIFDKLQVQRRTEAVARARELGLL